MLALSIRIALSSLRNKPLARMLVIASVAFVLFVSSIVILIKGQFSGALQDVKASYFLTANIDPAAGADKEKDILAAIKKFDGVASAELVDKEAFIENFNKHFPSLAKDLTALDADAIPRYVKIRVRQEDASGLKVSVEKISGVQSVDMNEQKFSALQAALSSLQKFSYLVLIGAFAALISLLINHFKLDSAHRMQIITTMKLLGAKKVYWTVPFAVEGLLEGLVAGAIASIAMFAFSATFVSYVESLFQALGYSVTAVNTGSIGSGLFITGGLCGLFASLWSISLSRAGK